MHKKILIADDELRLRILIADFLILEGYTVLEAKDGKEALDIFRKTPDIEMVILDVMMPYYDGWQVCREIRKTSHVPIIMVTAKDTEPDELVGFTAGADEYITKPFSPSIFVARVNALYNRTYPHYKKDVLIRGVITIDLQKHAVSVDGVLINLSHTEYKILTFLMENEGRVMTRDSLLDHVWGYDYDGTDRTVDTHINRLRTKMLNGGDHIKTVRGYGYKFEVNAHELH
ncbi:response regulator transcription factor [Vallitalea pronyensis]|uniref:Stage 0 sporulation protein A homolog n=1 Tax=Vallitalea pronyensis TaxID=1348613 RepID=A0A8J8MH26_9FIRM|nr:response regulator transcription factor [Vallitalea pronyensis]QUI21677.1 response regulator transcription factor [Vallitalea pronyensis]